MSQVPESSNEGWKSIPRAIYLFVCLSAEVVLQSTCDRLALSLEVLDSNYVIFHIAFRVNPSTVCIDIARSLIFIISES
jgi:hypothetical protein